MIGIPVTSLIGLFSGASAVRFRLQLCFAILSASLLAFLLIKISIEDNHLVCCLMVDSITGVSEIHVGHIR